MDHAAPDAGHTSTNTEQRPDVLSDLALDTILAGTEVFAALDVNVRGRLATQFEPVSVAGGTVLIREGEPADAVWLVVNGRLGSFSSNGVGGRLLGEIGRGQIVGEMALISDRPRRATVRALRDTELLRLSAASFRLLVHANPEVLLQLSATLVERLAPHAPTDRSRPSLATIAVLPAGEAGGVDLSGFCRHLAAALSAVGSVRHLRGQDIDNALGQTASQVRLGDERNCEVVGWLQQLEEDRDYVIYQADSHESAWSRRCLRQADRVLLVGHAASDPAPGPGDSLVADHESQARCELVLLHEPGGGAPMNTGAWLKPRSVDAHHHVSIGQPHDYQRLARVLSGRAVGVVLGGGGARGLAHLGVLRALEEAGVPIDAVGGTSIGAIMAAMVAIGWDHEARVANAMASFVNTRFLLGFTFPAVAMSSAQKLTRLLRSHDYLGETAIEDLWRPFFCVSTSLSRAEIVVHERGPTWWAVRASIALPGILPPIWADGDLLVDGGVLDDLPVDVMRSRSSGRVVAVDLRPPPDDRRGDAFDAVVSGWRVLGRRLNPFTASPDLPGALEVMTRAKDLAVRCAQRRYCGDDIDLYLHPPTDACRSLDFRSGGDLIELGYRYASEQIELTMASRGGALWS